VPDARRYAWDELRRNTLAAHATAFPRAWDGVISVDDACFAYYTTTPGRCGVGLTATYSTQILHQPAWSLFDAIRLAGITPTPDGYRIAPHVPSPRFALRLPVVGIAGDRRSLRGYVRPEQGGPIRLEVALPAGARGIATWVGGRRVAHTASGGFVRFVAALQAGHATDWAVSW
jgi:hypothetical protein